ncbi:DUF6807 family protein [Kutzneria sp. NPDC051319]|uniref:DUF6807 family protein n=1 Tax=Kutzneria sp. NPDC051319 TaxID=3155047 RepID=UPI00344A4C79
MRPRVVLAGASGYGRSYLRQLVDLDAAGRLRFVGVCEVNPLDDEGRRLVGARPVDTELGRLLAATGADIGIVATPIPTHVPLAHQVLDAGAHLLLEKPPTMTLGDWNRLVTRVGEAGVACQIGFQSLGSQAFTRLASLIRDGELGIVTGIGVRGRWRRPDDYYRRASWAGRRELGDGALANPFAHGIATALELDGSTGVLDVPSIELELFRARDINADDTSCLRLRTARGTTVVIAVTLCAEDEEEPVLIVHGTAGRAELHYTLNRLVRPGRTEDFGCVSPLENLLAHLADPAVPLQSPVQRCGGFTRVLEAIRTAPDPLPIGAENVRRRGEYVDVVGVDAVVGRAAEELRTFSELEAPWVTGLLKDVTEYGWDKVSLPQVVPRPALHPVRTLHGTVVTAEHPEDHRWHRGIGLALPDVNGVNLWGGPTYRRGLGYVEGELGQVREIEPDVVEWCDAAGQGLLRERRRIEVRPHTGGWELVWHSVLSAETDVVLNSPGSNGRPGAGYGGWFWRLPTLDPELVEVFTPDFYGEEQVNGARAEWLAVVVHDPDAPWTAVLSGPDDPWFVRVGQYQGVGSALAWERPRVVHAGEQLDITVRMVLLDGVHRRA